MGTNLGSPLLPLTIESQDFENATSIKPANSNERKLLEQWYILDKKSEPPCYCLKTKNISSDATFDLHKLYQVLIEIFSKELRDSYMTTILEQELNNMVFINQEQSKRGIWIHTGALPSKPSDAADQSVGAEMNRRLSNVQAELKVTHLVHLVACLKIDC